MSVVELAALAKSYGKVEALRDLDLRVESGECFGLIGPNGAGKTTTLKVLATLVKPDRGLAVVDGIDVVDRPDLIRQQVGFMPDIFQSYGQTKIVHYLDYFAALVGLRGRERTRRVSQVLELTDLVPKREDLVGGLSRGNKQRLCLAKTLLHNPRVLLLDEPASGLDPRARIEMRLLLREMKSMGKTILISSHILEDLQEICDRVAIYEAGELLKVGGLADLTGEYARGLSLSLRVRGDATALAAELRGVPGVARVDVRGARELRVGLDADREDGSVVLRWLLDRGVSVESFREDRPVLADVFLDLTEGSVT
jgi:ABC-2 type transport system ATP-binding protein